MLAQVGIAVVQLRSLGYPLELTAEEQGHIVDHTVRLVESLTAGPLVLHLDFESIISGIRSLVTEVGIPRDTAENLFDHAELVIESQYELSPRWFRDHAEISLAIAFGLIPGLVRALPDKTDQITHWVRTGLASDDDLWISCAVSALRYWTSQPETLVPMVPPDVDDLILEVGVIIASRRRVALADALWCAIAIFDGRLHWVGEMTTRLVLQGLAYLAEELSYDRDIHDAEQIPTLRWLCARLAATLTQHDFGEVPAVAEWLEIAKDDPFPEVRNAAMATESEEDV